MRRLTNRQAALLAAVERAGRVTVMDLGGASALARRLETLVGRGLLKTEGDPRNIYLGRPELWSTPPPWLTPSGIRDFSPYWFVPARSASGADPCQTEAA